MLEKYLKSEVTRNRLRSGISAPYIDDFSDWLHKQGFKPVVIDHKLRYLASFSDWAKSKNIIINNIVKAVDELKEELEINGRKLHSRGPNDKSVIAAKKFIQFLQEHGVIEKPPAKLTPSEKWPIIGEFRSWASKHRGLRDTTLDLYDTTLRDFVRVLGEDPIKYTAKSVREFLIERARQHSRSRAQALGVAVRAFLRFLGVYGLCSHDLIYAVPSYSGFKAVSAPQYIEPSDLKRVEESCHTRDENGLRDRAVVLLLTRLGLRASDVANLCVKDIDWHNGRIAVLGKNRKQEWLPLPQQVGDAILQYLKNGRSKFKTERVFIKVDAPIGPLTRASVTHIVRSAFLRTGIKAPVNGAHTLRHSAATAMLRQGVTLQGVGAILRHSSPATTSIYAKVDFDLLIEVAQPWPEVVLC